MFIVREVIIALRMREIAIIPENVKDTKVAARLEISPSVKPVVIMKTGTIVKYTAVPVTRYKAENMQDVIPVGMLSRIRHVKRRGSIRMVISVPALEKVDRRGEK